MSEESSMGIFDAVQNGRQNSSIKSNIVDLETYEQNDRNSDTIYNLLFKEYDEEQG